MENLLISTIYRNDKSFLTELTKLASKHECNVNFGHLYALGPDNTLSLQIAGNWSSIAKIEAALPSLAKRHEIELVFKRSHQEKVDSYFLPYKIEIITVEQPGAVYEIIEFLVSLSVQIQQFEIQTKMHQRTPLLKLNLLIEIPADNNIADIREQFLVFCDELNLDGTLEPAR